MTYKTNDWLFMKFSTVYVSNYFPVWTSNYYALKKFEYEVYASSF